MSAMFFGNIETEKKMPDAKNKMRSIMGTIFSNVGQKTANEAHSIPQPSPSKGVRRNAAKSPVQSET